MIPTEYRNMHHDKGLCTNDQLFPFQNTTICSQHHLVTKGNEQKSDGILATNEEKARQKH